MLSKGVLSSSLAIETKIFYLVYTIHLFVCTSSILLRFGDLPQEGYKQTEESESQDNYIRKHFLKK